MSATQRSLGSDLGPRLRPFARAIAGSINRRRCCESSETGPSRPIPISWNSDALIGSCCARRLGPAPRCSTSALIYTDGRSRSALSCLTQTFGLVNKFHS